MDGHDRTSARGRSQGPIKGRPGGQGQARWTRAGSRSDKYKASPGLRDRGNALLHIMSIGTGCRLFDEGVMRHLHVNDTFPATCPDARLNWWILQQSGEATSISG